MTARHEPAAHPIKELLSFFDGLYTKHVGARYPVNGGKDAKAIQWMRGLYSDDDIRAFMVAFFEIKDEFIQRSGYGLGVLRGCLPKIIQFVKQQRKPANGVPDVETTNRLYLTK